MDSGAAPPLLRRLLTAAGYRLTDTVKGLLCVRRSDRRALFIVDGLRSPTELEGEFPSDSLHRTLLYSGEPGDVPRAAAAERGMEILDPLSLGPGLGELLLLADSQASDEEPLVVVPEPPVATPETMFPSGERTGKPRISRTDAETLAGVEGFRCTLRLVPYYVSPYRVRTTAPHGGFSPTAGHLVAVNALSGRCEIWEDGEREFVDEIEEPHQRLEPTLTEEQCHARAERVLRRRHTGSIDHTEQHDGAIIIERRKVAPGPDDLKIGPAALVHVPFWYVEGVGGRVVLDAVTGERVGPPEKERDV